jgi:hypothetical protein
MCIPVNTHTRTHTHTLLQFLAWDTAARRRIDLVGRRDDGDKVVAHEFDHRVVNQVGAAGLCTRESSPVCDMPVWVRPCSVCGGGGGGW